MTPEALVGLKVKARRAALGMTQRRLAAEVQRLGTTLDPSAVTRIEKGQRSVTFIEMARICAILRLEISELSEMVAVDLTPDRMAEARNRRIEEILEELATLVGEAA